MTDVLNIVGVRDTDFKRKLEQCNERLYFSL
jgi:hypothetical protein